MTKQQVDKIHYNRSTYFLLPLLAIPFEIINGSQSHNFINTYLRIVVEGKDRKNRTFPNYFYVEVKESAEFSLFDKYANNLDYYIGYKYSDKGTIYIFKMNESMIHVKELLLKGKYSKIPEITKQKIVKYIALTLKDSNNKIIDNPNYKAMFPNEESRRALEIILDAKLPADAEILSPLNINKETKIL